MCVKNLKLAQIAGELRGLGCSKHDNLAKLCREMDGMKRICNKHDKRR
jgi:hypothetical protein